MDSGSAHNLAQTELMVGEWLRDQERSTVIVATRVPGLGLGRVHIERSLEESLKRLRTNYIDVYYIHYSTTKATSPLETIDTLNNLVLSGKVRYIGAANFPVWKLEQWMRLIDRFDFAQFRFLQTQYNILERYSESEITSLCNKRPISLLPLSPIRSGVLTEKYFQDFLALHKVAIGSRKLRCDGNARKVLVVVNAIALDNYQTIPQVALRWLLQKKAVASVMISPRDIKELEENMAAGGGWELSEEDMANLDRVSAITIPLPNQRLE